MDLGAIANSAQLGAAIRAARTRAGLTQQELANRSGASRRWLSMVEKGENPGVELEGELLDQLDQEGL